jgi:hypothetical protein
VALALGVCRVGALVGRGQPHPVGKGV